MPARAALIKHAITGRLASLKSKTGLPQCSQAVSAWAKPQATSVNFAILAQLRAAAKLDKHGLPERNLADEGGSEAKIQNLIRRIQSGTPLTTRERTAKAKELRARLAESRLASARSIRPGGRESAV